MKKLLAMLLALTLTFSLVACGGGEEEPAAEEKPAASEPAKEEAKEEAPAEEEEAPAEEAVDTAEFEEAYNAMLEAYNTVVDAANQYPEFLEETGYGEAFNELSVAVDEMTASIDLETITEEDMAAYAEGMTSTMDALQAIVADLQSYEEYLAAEEVPEDAEGSLNVQGILDVTSYAYGGDVGTDSIILCFDEAATYGIVVVCTTETNEFMCLSGPLTIYEDTSMAITDEATGAEYQFAMVDNGDGTAAFADATGTEAIVAELDGDTLTAALEEISATMSYMPAA